MKKQMAIWLALCMLLCCGWTQAMGETVAQETEAPEQAEERELPTVDEFFRSMVGRLSFTLSGLPSIQREADITEDDARKLSIYTGWVNKLQLTGCSETGAEFQVHIGDLTPAMNMMRADHPGEDEAEYQMNAMVNLAKVYLGMFDGEITKGPEAGLIEQGDTLFPVMGFSYRYPDAEGVSYSAKAMMDGNLVVLMMCQLDDMNEAILVDFHPVAAEEAEEFRNRQPEQVTLGRMQITFPVPPEKHESEGHVFYHVFSPDYAYLTAEHMELFLAWMLEGDDPDAFLEKMIRGVAEQYRQEGYFDDYTVSKAADGVYMFEAVYGGDPGVEMPEGMGQVRDITRVYVTMDGVYTVDATDTPMGRAYLDSIVFAEEE